LAFIVDTVSSSHAVSWAVWLTDSLAESKGIRALDATIVSIDRHRSLFIAYSFIFANLNMELSVGAASSTLELETIRSTTTA